MPTKTRRGGKQVGVRFDADMVAALNAEARLKRVSVSDVVRQVILAWMQARKLEKESK